jgi:hypothetical protein
VREVPGGVMPILGAVLAERGEHDAVLESRAAEAQWLEELGDRRVVRLRIGGCPCRWLLRGCEVGNLDCAQSQWLLRLLGEERCIGKVR